MYIITYIEITPDPMMEAKQCTLTSHSSTTSLKASYSLSSLYLLCTLTGCICSEVFAALNLKKHIVGGKEMYGPGDIEGHWGSDGELYLLDFSRFLLSLCQFVMPISLLDNLIFTLFFSIFKALSS